jgi:hypothetical protein
MDLVYAVRWTASVALRLLAKPNRTQQEMQVSKAPRLHPEIRLNKATSNFETSQGSMEVLWRAQIEWIELQSKVQFRRMGSGSRLLRVDCGALNAFILTEAFC